ncbi:MAG: hypothetical protein M1821_002721 [Bathelium mastoideum]|nr:MAG: hypothetical protein M1821_002721 [Bathelium mastoideum]
MADLNGATDPSLPQLNLTPEEKRVFGQLFGQADSDNLGVVTGEVAVKFFERTKLAPSVLGEIWQIADTENRGLLTKAGFCVVLRLIGHYQAGRDPTPELALRPGPLPKFEGLSLPSAAPAPAGPAPTIQPQSSGGPIRVPPLAADKVNEYSSLFEKSGAQNGVLSGESAKSIFEKARLPNDVLGRIWNLADTEQRGALNVTEFIIAMHLLASYKSGAMRALPQSLPPGLYEAASRRQPVSAIPRQFSGSGSAPRGQSPVLRPPFGASPQANQQPKSDWLISPEEKSKYDSFFAKLDSERKGYITGEQAVRFFSDSALPEEILASIWDLADINSEGQLNKDEFAVAMYLIRQQRGADKPPLPTNLPPALIPPSMRAQSRPAQQPTAPAFNNAAYSSQLPKSASEDLFGLDAFSNSAPEQVQQSTGGSGSVTKPFDTDPFSGSKATSPTSPQSTGFQSQSSSFQQPQARNPAVVFKPFQPTSAFGQGLTTQGTGSSDRTQQRAQPSMIEDDLLGDNDPEVSKKLTSETTELANMSNQISTLRNQMQDVQTKKAATESDLSSTNTQRRDLELRLSQFRSQYEQEVKQVKSVEERLAASRSETKKLQQDLAMIEGTYQDLQNQHRQIATALEADQRENANLKDRIRQINAEISQLRPQLDKVRSEARQQKGMVAINKKQASTTEGERDRIKGEIDDYNKASQERARSVQASGTGTGSSVVSPAPSTASQSTNPFFRKQSSTSISERTLSPSRPAREASAPQPQNNFDSVFGPSYSTGQTNTPSQNSYRGDPGVPSFTAASGPSVNSSDGPSYPTPSTSPPSSSYRDSPHTAEPPAPPESRQITSTNLPFRTTSRTDSMSSSVKVAPPASRHEPAGSDTPTTYGASPIATPSQEGGSHRGFDRPDTSRADNTNFGFSSFDRNSTASPAASTHSDAARSGFKPEDPRDIHRAFGPSSATINEIPGAFPNTPAGQATPTGESSVTDRSKSTNEQSRAPMDSNPKVDFDAAFADFGPPPQAQERQSTGGSGSQIHGSHRFNQEFPPIEELNRQEDSDSEEERGFADNFTSASPPRKQDQALEHSRNISSISANTGASADVSQDQRPSVSQIPSSASMQLPTPGAQKSPPTYEQTISSQQSGRSGSNQFPPEFGGLLPSREDPTSSPEARSPERTFSSGMTSGQALFGVSAPSKSTPFDGPQGFSSSPPPADTPASTSNSEAYHSATSHPSGGDKSVVPSGQLGGPLGGPSNKSAFNDDFDSGFDDLTEAKEGDKSGVDDDVDIMFGSQHREGLDEFNPVFDSPANSKSNTVASQPTPTGTGTSAANNNSSRADDTNAFHDFEHGLGSASQSFSAPKAPQQPQPSSSHDWDAIFSGLDAPQQSDKFADLGSPSTTTGGDAAKQTSSSSAFDDDNNKTPTASLAGGGGGGGNSNNGVGGPSSGSGSATLATPASGVAQQPSQSQSQLQAQQMPQLGRAISSGTEHDDPILKKLTGMGYARADALHALEKYDYDINAVSGKDVL